MLPINHIAVSQLMPTPLDYPGIDGFLGTRASLMLDLVSLSMLVVLPAMFVSIWLVRFRQNYVLHKRIQLTLGVVLAVAVTAFEVDIRLNGWEERAVRPPVVSETEFAQLVHLTPKPEGYVYAALWVHLFFAVSTTVLWIFVIVQALRKIPKPPGPCEYSIRHMFWARLAAVDMCFTAMTGWFFYVLAFVF
jgi:uncharacterized membrane protein YozB (DUF420 family)